MNIICRHSLDKLTVYTIFAHNNAFLIGHCFDIGTKKIIFVISKVHKPSLSAEF